ncbi:coiled-coil domain-containing protein 169-like [Babylonia areolata]|uniref:coiled-coil domain-containing protein 169-like n=1 Tax=Babylonia areolata TaxID=304850 RepID=UPI003FCF5E1E
MAGGETIPDEYELERLRAEVQQERQMKEMLDQSAAELKATIDELEKRFDSIENEGNEWKTRFETQQEMNQQLERQVIMLQDKVEDARRNLREANKTPRDNRNFDDMADASPQMIKALDREKNLLANQLRDLEWRLDQESKAYHKANDERKQYSLEINAAKGTISEMKSRQKMITAPGQEPGSTPRSYRDTTGNIPNDQRIIDPKRGPIKKTAGVKSLPSLEA